MKNQICIIILAALALNSCNQQPDTVENKQAQVDPVKEFAKLNAFLKKFEEPSQFFQATSDKPIKVTGKQGTIIHINAADLEMENGDPVGKDIRIELTELSTQGQLMRSNAQTVSDGQLLVSGGAYFINVTSNGQQVRLKEGKTYSAEFPNLSAEEMTLYYGERDSSESMNWKQTDKVFIMPEPTMDSDKEYSAVIVTGKGRFTDTSIVPMKNTSKEEYAKIKKEATIKSKVYGPAAIDKFGWINCDRLFKPDAPRTNLQFAITNKAEEANFVNVYLIFQEIKSVTSESYFKLGDTIEGNSFDNVPVGMTVRFLAVCYQNEKILATLSDIMPVKENHNEMLTLQEMSEEDFDKLMRKVE